MSLRRLAFYRPMCSGGDTRALPRVGFPIRKSAGQRLFSASPRLIAAVHVLHRLLTPRHPPRALNILTRYIEHTYCRYAVFKVRGRQRFSAHQPVRENPDPEKRGRDPSRLNSIAIRLTPRASRTPQWCGSARMFRTTPGCRHSSRAWLARETRGSSTVSSKGVRSPGDA